MPVGSRDDRFARTQRIRKRTGDHLRLVAIRCDVYVRRTNELDHLLRANEAIVKDHIRFDPRFLRQPLQVRAIFITLTTQDVWVGRACNDVHDVLVSRQYLWKGLNNVFDALVGREQTEREQYSLPFYIKAVFVEIGIEKWQVRNAVRNHVNLAARHFEDLLQELGGELTHHDEAVGKLCDFFHYHSLIGARFAENRVQGGHHGHLQVT